MSTADDDAANQRLHWQLEELEARGVSQRERFPRMRELSVGYERSAAQRFGEGDLMAWSDLFAAITWAAKAGDRMRWRSLLQQGHERAEAMAEGRDEVEAELEDLRAWARALPVAPSLTNYAVAMPPRSLRPAA